MDTQQDMGGTQVPESSEQQGGFGPMIGILIIVALIVFGGLYFWGSHLISNGEGAKADAPKSFEVTSTTVEDGGSMTDEEFEALFNQGDAAAGAAADTLEAVVDDLGDLDSLDAELDALGSEL